MNASSEGSVTCLKLKYSTLAYHKEVWLFQILLTCMVLVQLKWLLDNDSYINYDTISSLYVDLFCFDFIEGLCVCVVQITGHKG